MHLLVPHHEAGRQEKESKSLLAGQEKGKASAMRFWRPLLIGCVVSVAGIWWLEWPLGYALPPMTSNLLGDYAGLADAPFGSGPVLFCFVLIVMFFSFLIFGRKK